MATNRAVGVSGGLGLHIIRKDEWVPPALVPLVRRVKWNAKTDLGRLIAECISHLPIDLAAELIIRLASCVVIESQLSLIVIKADDGSPLTLRTYDYGVVSRRVITTAGVNALATNFQASSAVLNYNFHAIGTGTNPEAIGDTALQTEAPNGTYAVSGTRPTGVKTNPSANVYQTVGSNVVAAGITVQEMGILSQAATGGGTLWDRFLTGTQTLLTGDTLQTTVKATFAAGG